MQIKTFEANSMAEALRAAKEAFGPEAVILGVKTRKSNGRFMGKWKRQKVALTAAMDTAYSEYDSVSISKKGIGSFSESSSNPDPQEMGAQKQLPAEDRRVIRTYTRARPPHIAKELLPQTYVKNLFWMQQQMLTSGVVEDAVQELIARVHIIAVRKTNVSQQALMNIMEEAIQDHIRLRPSPDSPGHMQKCLLFIGPTGVGKTTTIAKIATIYSQSRKSDIGLITLDDERIGGISQLAIYAKILDIPIKAATTPAGLRKALRTMSDKQLILIDTAGVNPNDAEQLSHLKELITQVEAPQLHLVLSTTTKSKDLKLISDAFYAFPVRNLLFTKVDESGSHGNILSSALQTGTALSYFTDGKKVPDNIHVMTASRLMDMVFNETTMRQAKAVSPEILAEKLQSFEMELSKHLMKIKPYRTYSTQWPSSSSQTGGVDYDRVSGSRANH